jgi:hypothetical protein
MFKKILLKFLNEIGLCPFYFFSLKEAKRLRPCGFVVWRIGFFSVILWCLGHAVLLFYIVMYLGNLRD